MQPFGAIKKIVPVSIDSLMLYFHGDNVEQANVFCYQWARGLAKAQAQLPWLKEIVPAYDSLMLVFDAFVIDSHQVYQALTHMAATLGSKEQENEQDTGAVKTLPVWYGAPTANDLAQVSEHTGLSQDEVIRLHSETTYRVFAVGFAPGFAYMGETPKVLHCPRLATPRKKVPKGAVAIADNQTAVYPLSSPGGWHLLGLCPLALVDSHSHSAYLNVGDKVKFTSISEYAFRNDYAD